MSTAQRLATAFVADDGATLYAGPNSDARGFLEAVEMQRTHGDHLRDVTGHQPPIVLVPPRLAWFRTHRPDVAARVAAVLPLSDWFGYRLTGVTAAEPSAAGDTGCLDVAGRSWAPDLAAACGVDAGLLPPLREAGDPHGAVAPAAAVETGLPAGLPVAVGCGDTMAALLGMGVTAPGQAGVVAGSTMPVVACAGVPPDDPSRRCWAGCHAPDGRWLLEANGGEAGIAQAWLARVMNVAPEDIHVMAAPAAPASGPLAFVNPGPLDFSDLPLVRTGEVQFPVPLLVLGAEPAAIARAFVENLAYTAATGLGWVAESVPVESVSVGGGLAESALFPGVLASVLARPVTRFGIDVTMRGAAALGLAALGETAPDPAGFGEAGAPVPEWAAPYRAALAAWQAEAERLAAGVGRFSSLL